MYRKPMGQGKRPMRKGPGGPGGHGGPPNDTPTRRLRRKKVCIFCVDKKLPDYKDVGGMLRFVSDRGRIVSRSQSGCCAQHQRTVATAVKRSREIGFIPFQTD